MPVFNSESEYESFLLANTARALKTHRGDFYPQCDYGSNLYKITKKPENLYALCAAAQALCGENGMFPVCAEKTETGYAITVLINGAERLVSISV